MSEDLVTNLNKRVKRLESVLGTLISWLQLNTGGLRPDEVEVLLRKLEGDN